MYVLTDITLYAVPTATSSSITMLETNYATTPAHSPQQTRQFHETVYHAEQSLEKTQSPTTQTGRVLH